ncbi:hypothetical protein SMICM17S_10881 [Streptomyces microflavus]
MPLVSPQKAQHSTDAHSSMYSGNFCAPSWLKTAMRLVHAYCRLRLLSIRQPDWGPRT